MESLIAVHNSFKNDKVIKRRVIILKFIEINGTAKAIIQTSNDLLDVVDVRVLQIDEFKNIKCIDDISMT